MDNMKIREIEISHGKNIVSNEYYLEHFKNQGKDVKHFFEDVMGKRVRYEYDKETENALTLAIESSKAVLEKANIQGKDIDMIVYTGTLPEYASPISAMLLHSSIKGKKECFCHDLNLNCMGMTYSLDMINRYIKTNPKINKVLLVGSDILTCGANPKLEGNYGQFGDVSCAIILERTEDSSRLIDTKVHVNTEYINNIRFPKCGNSHMFDDIPIEERLTEWIASPPWWVDGIIEDIRILLDENRLTLDDISMICFSQIAIRNILKVREALGVSEEKTIFVADTYGYTGTSSPMLALYESIKRGKVKRGDYIIIATAAFGGSYITELIKY